MTKTTPDLVAPCDVTIGRTPDIYRMKLHEHQKVDVFDVLRVPGGWLYGTQNLLAFVPFTNEFMTVQEPEDSYELQEARHGFGGQGW